MIALVLTQLAARRGQAVVLLLLSVAATLAAAGPANYARAVDQSAVETALAAADSSELLVSLPVSGREWRNPPAELPGFQAVAARLAGFTTITTVGLNVQGLGGPDAPAPDVHMLVGRDGFCRYATFRAGRCPVGSREAALPAALAAATGRGPGDRVVLTPVVNFQGQWIPAGPPVTVSLVGVFEATDPADPYWLPWDPLGTQRSQLAILTNRTVLQTMPHQQELFSFDAFPPRERFTAAELPRLRRQLAQADQRLREPGAGPGASALVSDLPQLLDRMSAPGERARALLPIAAAPLMAVCWLVIYLAVSHGVSGRRQEVAVVALRGVKPGTRTLVVAAEPVLPLLAGAPAGLLLAPALVSAVGPGGVVPLTLDPGQLLAAGLAAAGGILAALVALRQEFAAPVAQLLRRVPRRRTAVVAAEVIPVVLAAVMVAELRGLDGELVGVMVAAPAVVMLAVAVVLARGVRPLIERAGRRSLRRGRLGPAMAAIYLARRPGAARLLVVVLALVLGLLGFAFASVNVAAQGELTDARRSFGAGRVLQVEQVGRQELLHAVRAADPDGQYAMAVLSVPGRPGDPPAVAVDATRLAQVALWSPRPGEPDAGELARLLRPPAAEPVQIGDGELAADLSRTGRAADPTATLSLVLAPVTGGPPVVARFGPVASPERQTYRSEVTGCAGGCRLAGVTVAAAEDAFESDLAVALHALRLDGRDVGPAGWLADPERWRSPARGAAGDHLSVQLRGDGLRLSRQRARRSEEYWALAVDVPYPLPVAVAGQPPTADLLAGIDQELIRVSPQASLASLPRVGTAGVLMDLEYAERLTRGPGTATVPQVWLSQGAPERVVDQLRAQGLVISADRIIDQVQVSLAESGVAGVLRFYLLATGFAVLLGIGALALVMVVDQRTWGRELASLRAQGMADRTATAAAWWSYGGLVVAGTAAGALAAGAAWLAAGERLPLGLDRSLLTSWPQWMPVAVPGAVAVAALLAAAAAGAWWQRAAVRRSREVGG